MVHTRFQDPLPNVLDMFRDIFKMKLPNRHPDTKISVKLNRFSSSPLPKKGKITNRNDAVLEDDEIDVLRPDPDALQPFFPRSILHNLDLSSPLPSSPPSPFAQAFFRRANEASIRSDKDGLGVKRSVRVRPSDRRIRIHMVEPGDRLGMLAVETGGRRGGCGGG